MDRVVREIPIEGKFPLVSEPRFLPTKQTRKLVAKVQASTRSCIPIWLETTHSRNVVSLAGRCECECECEVVVQALSSVSDCGCEVDSIAITRKAMLGDWRAETRDLWPPQRDTDNGAGSTREFRAIR
jgi:hypothetical protein